jgi:hypothetical protein
MPAVLSEVELCNMALDLLKVPPITNIRDPKTQDESICSRWYDTTRRQVLRAHPWNFAKARGTLSRNATAPAFGYADKYALPNDFIRLRFIGDDIDTLQSVDYQIEEGFILMDNGGASSLNIGYIKDQTNVVKYDELFKSYLAQQMAYNMAYAFSGKETLRQGIKKMLDDTRMEARAINGQDNPPRRITRSKFMGARRIYSSGQINRSNPEIMPGV